MSIETLLEQHRIFKHNMLIDCKVQALPLILLSGDLGDISRVQVPTSQRSLGLAIQQDPESSLNLMDPHGIKSHRFMESV